MRVALGRPGLGNPRDDTFATITGIASADDRLLVTNSQIFAVPMLVPFTISSIPVPA